MLLYNNTFDKILLYAGKNYTPYVPKSVEAMMDVSYHYIVDPTQATLLSETSITCVQQIISKQKIKIYIKRLEDNKN